ncbi:MAG: cysteine protease StiP domain-containing protein [Dysosmobacter sp.]
MLPIEYEPSPAYLAAYEDVLRRYAPLTAYAVACVSRQIWQEKGDGAVLVSLARAGTSIGVLIKRFIAMRYHADVKHYTISIIRGGIDHNAMRYILDRHRPEQIQFVDGWTGKGAIQNELNQAMEAYPGVSPGLAVLSDPAHLAEKCGTHDDFLIASSCLNATVSGLLSRTFYRKDIIGEDEFHGAAYYSELLDRDLTYSFIEAVEAHFPMQAAGAFEETAVTKSAKDEVDESARRFSISDRNLVKPSIGEATRSAAARTLAGTGRSMHDEEHLGRIYQLAKEKGVALVEYPLVNYRACHSFERSRTIDDAKKCFCQ